jgi:hypothetical protein
MEPVPFRVVDDPAGIVHVQFEAPVMNKELSAGVCAEIERASARIPGRPLLLFNLSALRRSTPAAGFYAWRQVKRISPAAIAFYGGSRRLRRFARTVLRFAGFDAYGLFEAEAAAVAWLIEQKT